ncbi:MAG TPA: DUF6066 family protein [Myxococcaceae bacterium]|nr:DUF6066 family protein [Myxococcaceae bacterium]
MARLVVLPALLALVVPAIAAAGDADPRFARLLSKASTLPSLGSFLEKFVGDCQGSEDRPSCEAQAKAFRAQATNKRFQILLGEDEARMLAPGAFGDDGYSVRIAPLFAAGGYAVTHGSPSKIDAQGNPVVSWIEAREEANSEWNASQFQRLFSLRALRVHVVFTPQGVWSLPKKGGGKQYGVRAKVDGIYVTNGRTGDRVALWLADRS